MWIFGHVSHVWSAYASSKHAGGEPYPSGINSTAHPGPTENGFTLAQIEPVASMYGIEAANLRTVCADVIRLYHEKLEELDGRIASLVAFRDSAATRLQFLEQQRRDGGPV